MEAVALLFLVILLLHAALGAVVGFGWIGLRLLVERIFGPKEEEPNNLDHRPWYYEV